MMLLAVMVCQPCAHLLAFSANEMAVDMTANLISGSDEPVEQNGTKRSRRIKRDISMYERDGFIHVDVCVDYVLLRVQVQNGNGDIIYNVCFKNNEENQMVIDTSFIPSGEYYVGISIDGNSHEYCFAIE